MTLIHIVVSDRPMYTSGSTAKEGVIGSGSVGCAMGEVEIIALMVIQLLRSFGKGNSPVGQKTCNIHCRHDEDDVEPRVIVFRPPALVISFLTDGCLDVLVVFRFVEN
jgi:hypothetical protein